MKFSTDDERLKYERERQARWRNGIGREKWKSITRRSYQKNREKRLRESKDYNRSDKAIAARFLRRFHKKEYDRKRYLKKRDEIIERTKRYVVINRVKVNQRYRELRLKHPHKVRTRDRISASKRNARKKNCTINPVQIDTFIKSVMAKEFSICYYCQTLTHRDQIEFDHIIPLAKRGEHSVGNLCVSCYVCNRKKQDRLIPDWNKTGQLLLQL